MKERQKLDENYILVHHYSHPAFDSTRTSVGLPTQDNKKDTIIGIAKARYDESAVAPPPSFFLLLFTGINRLARIKSCIYWSFTRGQQSARRPPACVNNRSDARTTTVVCAISTPDLTIISRIIDDDSSMTSKPPS